METLANSANRGSVSTGYDIDNSCKFESGLTEFFNKSYSSASNRKTWTYSTWIKITETGVNNYFLDAYNNSNTWFILGIADTGKVIFYDIIAGTDYGKATNRLLRDTNAWYHIVFVSDTTNSTAADRYRLYINGVRETSFATDYGDPPQNYDGNVNNAITHSIGQRTDGPSYLDGYLAETVLVDGTALDPDSFGETDSASGIWKPKEITDTSFTWGTNGFWLNYSNAASMGANSAGTGGFSVQNINQNDQATDTPTNNFATFNQLHPKASGTNIANGNAQFYINSNYQTAVASIAVSKGKWYAEFSCDSTTSFIGIVDVNDHYIPQDHSGYYLGYAGSNQNRSVGLRLSDGALFNRTGGFYGASASANDILGIALDMDNRKVNFSVNGTWMSSDNSGNASAGATWNTSSTLGDAWTNVITMGVTGYSNIHWKCNFGGFTLLSTNGKSDANGRGVFNYDVPTGFYSLCSKNLAEFG